MLSISTLSTHHDKASFHSGIENLDHYLKQQASQDIRRHIAAVFVLTAANHPRIMGYYSLASCSIHAGELPNTLAKKLPKYPLLPATLLGRLAVDQKHQGQRLGELLLVDALKRSLLLSTEIASMMVIVEAKDDRATGFYQHYDFIKLPHSSNKLFLPMATISHLFVA